MCDLNKKLQAPFPAKDIEWRIGRSGEKNGNIWATALAYVSNRAIQARLDEVFGLFGWRNEYKEWHNDSQICGISVWDDEKKQWVTKWDGADNTNFEGTKGGLSDSMKRAAVQLGIGRYLYKLPETFVETTTDKNSMWNYAKTKVGESYKSFWWKEPELPEWALPLQEQSEQRNYTQEANECNTIEELNVWFTTTLSETEQKKYKALATERKKEIKSQKAA